MVEDGLVHRFVTIIGHHPPGARRQPSGIVSPVKKRGYPPPERRVIRRGELQLGLRVHSGGIKNDAVFLLTSRCGRGEPDDDQPAAVRDGSLGVFIGDNQHATAEAVLGPDAKHVLDAGFQLGDAQLVVPLRVRRSERAVTGHVVRVVKMPRAGRGAVRAEPRIGIHVNAHHATTPMRARRTASCPRRTTSLPLTAISPSLRACKSPTRPGSESPLPERKPDTSYFPPPCLG